ncbi:Unknown protein, partial [Striga hermonthica]
GCLGALDGTYIDVRVPSIDKARYRNRKGSVSINVLGVCDKNMNFVYMLSGWEGSAADSRVLRDAVTRTNGLRVSNGNYYLVDGGYTNGPGFLAPYRGVRYHLQEWGTGNRRPRNFRELYNLRHAKARNVIERAFGILKMRWAILRSCSYYTIRTQNRIIMACALLHNFIRTSMANDPMEALVHEIPTNGVSTTTNEDELIDQVEASPEWTQFRDRLAQDIIVCTGITMDYSCSHETGRASSQPSRRRVWSPAEEHALIDILKDIVNEGWRADNGFRQGYNFEIERRLKLKFPNCTIRADPHISSKIHVWRKNYVSVALIKGNSGFGWNEITKTFSCEDHVWIAWLK